MLLDLPTLQLRDFVYLVCGDFELSLSPPSLSDLTYMVGQPIKIPAETRERIQAAASGTVKWRESEN